MPAKKKAKKRSRRQVKMPAGFKKGQIVKVGRKHGKLPTGEAEVVGACGEAAVNVMFKGAGGKGRPRLGCVPVTSLSGAGGTRKRKTKQRRRAGPFGDADMIMAPTEIAGVAENPWFTDGAYKKRGKKIYPKGKKRK